MQVCACVRAHVQVGSLSVFYGHKLLNGQTLLRASQSTTFVRTIQASQMISAHSGALLFNSANAESSSSNSLSFNQRAGKNGSY